MTADQMHSLARHLDWLYGKHGAYPHAGRPCLCDHAYSNLGRLYGISMGKGWVRTSTHPDCVHHSRSKRAAGAGAQ